MSAQPDEPSGPEPKPVAQPQFHTEGGAVFTGPVEVRNGDVVGRDKNIYIGSIPVPRWLLWLLAVGIVLIAVSTTGAFGLLGWTIINPTPTATPTATPLPTVPPTATPTPTATPVVGAFNIYVAEFAVVSASGQISTSAEAHAIAVGIARLLKSQEAELTRVLGEQVLVWGTEQLVPPIQPGEEKQRLAQLQDPDILIYGSLRERADGTWAIQPKFYLTDEAVGQAAELGGEHALGAEIAVRSGTAGTREINTTLQTRLTALASMLVGLSYLTFGTQEGYASAGEAFRMVVEESAWAKEEKSTGQEVLYLFWGSAYLLQSYLTADDDPERRSLLEKSYAAYQQAQRRNENYARAYNGLGATLFQLARPPAELQDACAWDWAKLEEAGQNFEKALQLPASAKSPSGFVDLRANFSLGRVYYWQGACDTPEQWEKAQAYYADVLAAYAQISEPLANLTDMAAIAHADLGFMAFLQGDIKLRGDAAEQAEGHGLLQKALDHYSQMITLRRLSKTEDGLKHATTVLPFYLTTLCLETPGAPAVKVLDDFVALTKDPAAARTAILARVNAQLWEQCMQ